MHYEVSMVDGRRERIELPDREMFNKFQEWLAAKPGAPRGHVYELQQGQKTAISFEHITWMCFYDHDQPARSMSLRG